MKDKLIKNQILYECLRIKDKMISLNYNKEKKFISEIDYKFSIARINGSINALDFRDDNDIENSILKSIKIFQVMVDQTKVNFMDNNDPNYTMFYLVNGAISTLYRVLTVFENPLSCCPINKDIILEITLTSLDEKLKKAIKSEVKDIKAEIDIISKLYNDNKKFI